MADSSSSVMAGGGDAAPAQDPLYIQCFQMEKSPGQVEEEKRAYEGYKHAVAALPSEQQPWLPSLLLRRHAGFFFDEPILVAIMAAKDHFRPRSDDIVLSTFPKCGTTWLKSLVFATLHRRHHLLPAAPDPDRRHPLLCRSPHDCIPFLEGLYLTGSFPDLDALPSPRLINTHIPLSLLPRRTTGDGAAAAPGKIVYMARDPKDAFVSLQHFIIDIQERRSGGAGSDTISLEPAFESFSAGKSLFGPIWEHQLEYWEESLRRPEEVMFLRYEDLKLQGAAAAEIRRLAAFMGCPFSQAEEDAGAAEEIMRLCSFESLSKVGANREGVREMGKGESKIVFTNSSFFRKGKVGDWAELLTPAMAAKLDAIAGDKFRQSGLL